MNLRSCVLLMALTALFLTVDANAIPEELLNDPEKMVFEAMAEGANPLLIRHISENPKEYELFLLKYANRDISSSAQIRLVKIGVFVFDDAIFRREVDEALVFLDSADPTNRATIDLKRQVKALENVRFGDSLSEQGDDSDGVNLPKLNSTIVVEKPETEQLDEPAETLPSKLPLILGGIALFVIVVILVRSAKGKGDQP